MSKKILNILTVIILILMALSFLKPRDDSRLFYYKYYWKAQKAAQQKDPDKAEKFYIKAINEAQKAKLKNIDVADTYRNLAKLFEEKFLYEEAEEYFKLALSMKQELLGMNNPDVAAIMNDLGSLYDKQSKYKEAEGFFNRAVNIYEKYGKLPENLVAVLNNLGFMYFSQGRFEKAEKVQKHSLDIYKKCLNKKDSRTANMVLNLALTYSLQGKNKEAEELCRQSIPNYEEILTGKVNNDPEIAIIINKLSFIFLKQQKFDQAEQLQKQSLSINKSVPGLNHPNLIRDYLSLGNIYYAQNKNKEAEEFYKQALIVYENCEKSSSFNDPQLKAAIYSNLGDLYFEQKKYKDARIFYKKTLYIFKNIYGLDKSMIKGITDRLKSLDNQKG